MDPNIDRKGKKPLVEPSREEVIAARLRSSGGVSIPGRSEAANRPPSDSPTVGVPPGEVSSSPSGIIPPASGASSPPAGSGSPPLNISPGPGGICSILKERDIRRIRFQYQIPDSICLSAPWPGDKVTCGRGGGIALYEEFFKGGLRLPFHPFFLNLLNRYNLTPSQLTPNSIRIVYSFIVLCHFHGASARISLFRALYKLRNTSRGGWWGFVSRPKRVIKLDLPSKIKGWKSRFFYYHTDGMRRGWKSPDTSPNKCSTIEDRDRKLFDALLSSVIPRSAELLSEGNLRDALAAPVPSSPVSGERCPFQLLARNLFMVLVS